MVPRNVDRGRWSYGAINQLQSVLLLGLWWMFVARVTAFVARQCAQGAAWRHGQLEVSDGSSVTTAAARGRELEQQRRRWRSHVWWHALTTMVSRALALQLLGCWLFGFAMSKVDAQRRVSEGAQFQPTPNGLPLLACTPNAWRTLCFKIEV